MKLFKRLTSSSSSSESAGQMSAQSRKDFSDTAKRAVGVAKHYRDKIRQARLAAKSDNHSDSSQGFGFFTDDDAPITHASSPYNGESETDGNTLLTQRGQASRPRDRIGVFGDLVAITAAWSVRIILLFIAGWVAWRSLGLLWKGVLPILLALIICTLLCTPTRWMRKAHFPRWLAALISVLGALAVIVGLFSLIAPSAVDQSSALGDQFIAGLHKLQNYVEGPPFNLNDHQINGYVDEGIAKIQASSDKIVAGLVTGLSTVSDLAVMLGVVLMVTFFFLKDGDRFLPWLAKLAGRRGGDHVTEVLGRSWTTLGGFIRAQALVSLIDAVFIGAGLVILGIPLAMPLAILTFMAGFVPIVGAITSGFIAVVIALVSHGVTSAIIVLVIIIAVQQLEGNVLSPLLQSRAMNLHPAIVLLSVTVGSDLYGILGAFLAVPVAATIAVWIRYFSEIVDKNLEERTQSTENDSQKVI